MTSYTMGGNAKEQLKSTVKAIVALEEEKQAIADDIKEYYASAKGMGFDTKILRRVVAARKRDRNELEEERALFDLYLDASDVYTRMEA